MRYSLLTDGHITIPLFFTVMVQNLKKDRFFIIFNQEIIYTIDYSHPCPYFNHNMTVLITNNHKK